MNQLISVLALGVLASSIGACNGSVGYYDPYYYPWYYSDYGSWTVVSRPLVVVDDWTRRTFRGTHYRGYAIARHNSPSITYTATQRERSYEVVLTPRGDSTQVEVRARNGTDKWNREEAKALMGRILADYKTETTKR